MNQSSSILTARDLDEARERGALAGEVRALKWSAGFAIVALLGGMGLLYQNQIVLHERVVRVEERVMALEGHMARIEERMTRVEERLDGVEKQLATISSQLATLMSRQTRSP